jgi:hypothetical protein
MLFTSHNSEKGKENYILIMINTKKKLKIISSKKKEYYIILMQLNMKKDSKMVFMKG